MEALPERCRTLIRALMADPAPSYEDIAAAFDIPIGSIGPTPGAVPRAAQTAARNCRYLMTMIALLPYDDWQRRPQGGG